MSRLGLLCAVIGLGLLGALAKGARAGTEEPPAAGDVVTLHVAGDISYPNGWNGEAECEQSGAALFSEVRPLLERGELNFANLEMPLTERKATAKKPSVIVARPHRLAWVRAAGFNLLSIANNHILDAGKDGLLDTLRHLRAADQPDRPLFFAGAGETHEAARALRSFCAPRHKTRFGLLALSNISSPLVDADGGASTLERIRAAAASVDTLIVSVHSGIEYQIAPSASAVHRYRRYIDAGARVVAVHHSHVISAVERYHGGVIFYGLGNLSFNSKTLRIRKSTAPHFGMLGRVVLRDFALDIELAEVVGSPTLAISSGVLQLDLGPTAGEAMLAGGADPTPFRDAVPGASLLIRSDLRLSGSSTCNGVSAGLHASFVTGTLAPQ